MILMSQQPSAAYTYAIVLDFEATCDNRRHNPQPDPQEIIELPSVLVSLDTLEIVSEFESFVRPHHHPQLTPFCHELTSITQADVDGASEFPSVLAAHERWLDEYGLNEHNSLLVTCGDWDLVTMLPAQCPVAVPPVTTLRPIYTRWLNVKKLFCDVRQRSKAPGMAGMLKSLGLELTGHHHRGIDDCRNIAKILGALLQAGGGFGPSRELDLSKHPTILLG